MRYLIALTLILFCACGGPPERPCSSPGLCACVRACQGMRACVLHMGACGPEDMDGCPLHEEPAPERIRGYCQ